MERLRSFNTKAEYDLAASTFEDPTVTLIKSTYKVGYYDYRTRLKGDNIGKAAYYGGDEGVSPSVIKGHIVGNELGIPLNILTNRISGYSANLSRVKTQNRI